MLASRPTCTLSPGIRAIAIGWPGSAITTPAGQIAQLFIGGQ
jgi:hypothetical protein